VDRDWSNSVQAAFKSIAVIDPAKTAHVVIDMQKGFLEEGSIFEIPRAREVVANINAISEVLRRAGGLVVYVRFTVDDQEEHQWSSFWDRRSEEATRQSKAAFTKGSHGHATWSELSYHEDDLTIDKTRPSAFVPGTCALPEELNRRGIDTLIISGTLTNCCCESTARDAGQRNFKVIFASDACAALDAEAHNETCRNLALFGFADVRPTSGVMDLLEDARISACVPSVRPGRTLSVHTPAVPDP
jgi:ureidoacrylate peracid hydrolase